MEVLFHPDAVEEASAARIWYEQRSRQAARAFVAELDRAVSNLAESPHRWPPGPAGTRQLPMRRFPFVIVYRVGAEELHVVAVAHQSRRPGYWKHRR